MYSVCHGKGKSPYVSLFLAKWHPTLSLFSSFPFFSWTPSLLAHHQSKFSERSFSTVAAAALPTTNHEDYEGPFRPLLSVSLPLRHFRSFSLIRAPSWPAGGLNGQLCTLYKNIGQKTYLKKKWVRMKLVGTSDIIHSYYYLPITTQYAIINHVAAAEIDDPNFYNIYITLHAWLIEVVS